MAKRLFIALELPADCREWLAAVAEPIPGVRWLPKEQADLSLAFLGDVDEEPERPLRHSLAVVRAPSFDVRLQGIGIFGGWRRAVVWAGVDDR